MLDGLDGRVARLTHTQSEFGAEYDSLSDMVSFGAAPALVMYEWALKDIGQASAGSLPSSIARGAALRLARFNTNIDVVDKRYLPGIAQPRGGGASSPAWCGCSHDNWASTGNSEYGISVGRLDLHACTPGVTMVSNVPFYSFKEFNPCKKAVPFWVVVLVRRSRFAVISLKPLGGAVPHGLLLLRRLGLRALVRSARAHQAAAA